MSIGRLAARAVIGGMFVGHGTQKLFGWFGGPGPKGTEAMMESLELRPARVNALAAGLTETVGGTLLAAGLATPLAAAGLTGVMTTAIRKVHLDKGFWAANGGWEYNAVLIAAVTALAETGPGPLSLDHALGIERRGPAWALGALALGMVMAGATISLAGRASGRATEAPDATAVAAAHDETAGDPTTREA
jgi:putative oxidoreductase